VSLTAQLRLQTFLNASFPIGAFTCSHGIETAIQDGRLHDDSSCLDWITTILTCGSGWNEAVLMNHAYHLARAGLHSNTEALRELNSLALALQAGQERWFETTTLGASFLAAARAWPQSAQIQWHEVGDELALPVVIGALGRMHDMEKDALLASALQSTASNMVWIATRLIPLGQSKSLGIIAQLELHCCAVALKAIGTSLDDLGSCAVLADIASLQHETLHSRVCRT